MVQQHGATTWCNNMVQQHGATTWCNNMVQQHQIGRQSLYAGCQNSDGDPSKDRSLFLDMSVSNLTRTCQKRVSDRWLNLENRL